MRGRLRSPSHKWPRIHACARLIRQTGDLYMFCSDYPHSEGTATPFADYTAGPSPLAPADAPGLFHDNVSLLLQR